MTPCSSAAPGRPGSSEHQPQHINTEQLLLWVSDSLPFCLVYEPERQVTRFCLICHYQRNNRQPLNAHARSGDSVDSFNVSGNHDSSKNNPNLHPAGLSFNSSQQNASALGLGHMPQVFGPSQVSLVTQFEAPGSAEGPPDRVHVSRGLADSHELTVSLFFKASRQVAVYSALVAVNADLEFSQKAVWQNIDAMESLDYSNGSAMRGEASSIKLISKTMLRKLNQGAGEQLQGGR